MAEPAYWASRKRAMSLSQTVVLNGIYITKTRVPLHKYGVLLFGFILTSPQFLFGANSIPTALSRQKGVGKNFLAKRGEGGRKQATGVCTGGQSGERGSKGNGKMEDKTGDKT